MARDILIECYDEGSLENIVSLEEGRFSQAVYLYFTGMNAPSPERIDTLRTFIRRRFHIPTEFLPVRERSIAAVCRAFDRVLRGGCGCVMDLTGGEELFCAAAGYYVAQAGHESVTLRQYDLRRGVTAFCHPAEGRRMSPPALSVPECVALQGAVVMHSFPYDGRDSALEGEILRLWEAVKDDPRHWNHFCSLSGSARGTEAGRLEKCVASPHEAESYEAIAARLRRCDILRDEQQRTVKGKPYRSFTLNVAKSARSLYRKGGNLLELYCALAAFRTGSFQDCRVSVSLDWDSRIRRHTPDVRNEIDVMAVYGHIPVLVSCKNTKLENEYLYEIMTMAKHYGGRHARPVIVSSVENLPNIRLRAEEMGVLLIEDVQSLSPEAFSDRFRSAFPPR